MLWKTVVAHWKAIVFALMFVWVAIAGKLANSYHDKYLQADKDLKLATQTIADMQTRQRDVASLDAKYTQELADAKAQNDALQRKLDNGGRVLVKGRCPVPATTQTTGAPGLGNDASVELSDVAGRNVLSIRSGIISDQKSLRVLQEYIKTQCLK